MKKSYLLYLIFTCFYMQAILPIIPWKIFKKMAISAIKNKIFGVIQERPTSPNLQNEQTRNYDKTKNMHSKLFLKKFKNTIIENNGDCQKDTLCTFSCNNTLSGN